MFVCQFSKMLSPSNTIDYSANSVATSSRSTLFANSAICVSGTEELQTSWCFADNSDTISYFVSITNRSTVSIGREIWSITPQLFLLPLLGLLHYEYLTRCELHQLPGKTPGQGTTEHVMRFLVGLRPP